jgi:hypothetical protein
MTMPGAAYGLTRTQREYELQWMLRRTSRDPAKIPEFLGEVIVTLIEKNNRALARSWADEDRQDDPETL